MSFSICSRSSSATSSVDRCAWPSSDIGAVLRSRRLSGRVGRRRRCGAPGSCWSPPASSAGCRPRRSPGRRGWQTPSWTRPVSTWRTISSVVFTVQTRCASAPHSSAICRCTFSSGVNTRIRCSGCSRDSRRAVSPVWVNATRATAPSASPMSRAALATAPPWVRGLCAQRRHPPAGRLDRGDDAGHRRDRLHRVGADAGLARQHHRVGAVEHRVGDVGRLGPGRARMGDHRLEHLGRDDHRLGVVAADLDRPLLHDRHLLERHLDAEVAARDHDAVEGEHDLFEPVDRLGLLDLGDDRAVDADLVHDLVHELDVFGRAHERQRDEVDARAAARTRGRRRPCPTSPAPTPRRRAATGPCCC